mmetsp:Transcript_17728/g.49896  ORF Transcript_17728/g.49896 Transcript_17728/m.49896 type:complete len:480 (+) Transcript_17728:102-1541(+)|eukprot:CAMPEP_0119155300 /NCGR_PEP_ID=MMETSP1310-20130426/51677_1 /TAXON_ID=464262 /ORGANISM="Genus nov. species nov., Strain RCC2339" /LENGTH=479 /DNA_ID=CAMNT_0007147891 /DNA_START=76 /DNA_END=1515 /DNA_ORIENTATION=-
MADVGKKKEKKEKKEEKKERKEEKKEKKEDKKKEKKKIEAEDGDGDPANKKFKSRRSLVMDDRRKSWKKGDNLQPETMGQQRTLEMFVLSFTMKRLRGTNWQYYDIVYDPEDTSGQEENEQGEFGSGKDEGKRKSVTSSTNLLPSLASVGGDALYNKVHDLSQDDLAKYETVLLVHTGGLRPEAHCQHMLCMASHGYRVIAPCFPASLDEIEDYAAGLVLILKHENIPVVHFVGLGLGSMVGQYMLSKEIYSSMIKSACLTHLLPPNEDWIDKFVKAIKKMDFHVPMLTSILLGYKATAKDMESFEGFSNDKRELWLVTLRKLQSPKESIAARTQAIVDICEKINFGEADFTHFEGPVLLMQAKHVTLPGEEEAYQEARKCFPKALHAEVTGGPLHFVVSGKSVAENICTFLQEEFGKPYIQTLRKKNSKRNAGGEGSGGKGMKRNASNEPAMVAKDGKKDGKKKKGAGAGKAGEDYRF